MKLRNKKTGEIGYTQNDRLVVSDFSGVFKIKNYRSLAELCEEWEDVPREWPQVGDDYYAIHNNGTIGHHHWEQRQEDQGRPKFNCFKTKEDAEDFLEKWGAWQRLKDKGFGFGGYTRNQTGTYEILLKREIPYSYYDNMEKDLDLLFGGEE